MANLNKTIIQGFKIGVPPSALQKQFVIILIQYKNQRAKLLTVLQEADHRFLSLQQQIFA